MQLGRSVEGRDEKGIKKTVCAFLKMLHPTDSPSDTEFEEYVAYAIECRRRIKEQMNKRKPDDEFARIDLSYIGSDGAEVVVFCPESRQAPATLEPIRRRLQKEEAKAPASDSLRDTEPAGSPQDIAPSGGAPQQDGATAPALTEQHFTIQYGETGHTYDSIFGAYLMGARAVSIEDPYIRAPHQIANFLRFCETVLKAPTIRRIDLTTNYDDKTDLAMVNERLLELKQSLLDYDVVLEIAVSSTLHDREIRVDNGWIVKIGRGLDIYQKPDGWFSVGAHDFSLRKCLETKSGYFPVMGMHVVGIARPLRSRAVPRSRHQDWGVQCVAVDPWQPGHAATPSVPTPIPP